MICPETRPFTSSMPVDQDLLDDIMPDMVILDVCLAKKGMNIAKVGVNAAGSLELFDQ